MSKIKIVATGETEQDKNQKRGKLFEKIIADVLRTMGYSIDQIPNVNYAGMEIDIEGKLTIAGTPMIAECKCYKTDIVSKELQAFWGKYTSRYFKNNKCHGLFIALPGLNSHALGFYNESIRTNSSTTFKIFQENEIIDFLIKSNTIVDNKIFQINIDAKLGTSGDSFIVFSELENPIWVQYMIPVGSNIANKIMLFDSKGKNISDQETINYYRELLTELSSFEILTINQNNKRSFEKNDIPEEIVELKGSSEYFEYQFPSSPDFFIGRVDILSSFKKFTDDVLNKKTSCRSILFEANSGWGKSSVILSCVNQLSINGHFGIALDSRSAVTSQYLMKSVEYVFLKFRQSDKGFIDKKVITGYEGAINLLIDIGKYLETKNQLLFIFFDQFENIFSKSELLDSITQMCLKISDANTNILLGFAWKTDLIGLTREFPYLLRDKIIDSSKRVNLQKFNDKETNILIDKLAKELHSKLREDLRFLLTEFSQGYPWLLNKLCAHVKSQRNAGMTQAEIARGVLNVKELFKSDLNGLSSEELNTLKLIAKFAPVNLTDLSDEYNPEIIQSLIHRRLIVRVGPKYDIYWDIFRDYLNTDTIPIQEHYMIRAQFRSVINSVDILKKYDGHLSIEKFREFTGLSSNNSFYNIARDLQILELVKIINSEVILILENKNESDDNFHSFLKEYLRERLKGNQVVKSIIDTLNENNELFVTDICAILKQSFGYISANEKTWLTYSKILTSWLDFTDLAILDSNTKKISNFKPGTEIRDRKTISIRKREKTSHPIIQFNPVCMVADRIVIAITEKSRIDVSDISPSKYYKSLFMLEDLNLIERKPKSIVVKSELFKFVKDKEFRNEFTINALKKLEIFNNFLSLLDNFKMSNISHKALANEFRKEYNTNWSVGTAEVNVKIMMDWARHLGLAPGRFSGSRKRKYNKKNIGTINTLF